MTKPKTTRRVYSADELHSLRTTCSQPKLREAIEENEVEDADLVKGKFAALCSFGITTNTLLGTSRPPRLARIHNWSTLFFNIFDLHRRLLSPSTFLWTTSHPPSPSTATGLSRYSTHPHPAERAALYTKLTRLLQNMSFAARDPSPLTPFAHAPLATRFAFHQTKRIAPRPKPRTVASLLVNIHPAKAAYLERLLPTARSSVLLLCRSLALRQRHH